MALLKIIKLAEGVWKHNSDLDGDFALTRLYAKIEFGQFLIVEAYGAKRRKYAINQIEVYNIGGTAETFANFDDLQIRLKALNYIGYDASFNGVVLTDSSFGAFANGLTTEDAVADGDMFNFVDVSDSNKQKKTGWLNIKDKLKTYFDTLYQAILVSGTNIKTVNGSSLLGSGNLTIGGGVLDTLKTTTSASLATLDVDGFLTYVNGVTSFAIASNEIVKYQITDTGQIFEILVNNRSVGSGQTALTSADVLELEKAHFNTLFPNKVSWKANGSVSSGIGALALTGVGTASQQVNYGGFDFWLRTVSSASAGTTISQKETNILRVLSGSGFYYQFRVKQMDASSISDARYIYGLSSAAAIGNIEPSTASNQIVAFGADGTDTNCQIIYKANLGSATKINLGASFPKSQTNDYLVTFFRMKGSTLIYYSVVNVTTGATAKGSFTYTTDSLTPVFNKNNNASAISCGFDIQRVELSIAD